MRGDGRLSWLDDEFDVGADHIHEFRTSGCTQVRQIARPDELAALREVVRGLLDTRSPAAREVGNGPRPPLVALMRASRSVPVLRRFVLARRFAGVAAALLGVGAVRLYQDALLRKEPGGRPTPWHQDHVHWPIDSDRTATMWLPLADLPANGGILAFVPGSHRRSDLGLYELAERSEAAACTVLAHQRLPIRSYGPMLTGDATFHAGWTLHRAERNATTIPRDVMTVIYYADGARLVSEASPEQEPDLQLFEGVAPGGLAVGTEHPVLFARRRDGCRGPSERRRP